jgi:hypothetical protein
MYWNCYTLTGKVSAHHRRFLHPIQPRSMYPTKYSSYKALGYRKPCAHQRKMRAGDFHVGCAAHPGKRSSG